MRGLCWRFRRFCLPGTGGQVARPHIPQVLAAVALEGPPADLVSAHGGAPRVEVRADDETAARDALAGSGYAFVSDERRLVVDDVAPEDVGQVASTLADAGVEYEGLLWRRPDLEEVYLQLTGQAVGASGEPREVGDA